MLVFGFPSEIVFSSYFVKQSFILLFVIITYVSLLIDTVIIYHSTPPTDTILFAFFAAPPRSQLLFCYRDTTRESPGFDEVISLLFPIHRFIHVFKSLISD